MDDEIIKKNPPTFNLHCIPPDLVYDTLLKSQISLQMQDIYSQDCPNP